MKMYIEFLCCCSSSSYIQRWSFELLKKNFLIYFNKCLSLSLVKGNKNLKTIFNSTLRFDFLFVQIEKIYSPLFQMVLNSFHVIHLCVYILNCHYFCYFQKVFF